jgi:hypothetical protein
MLSTIFHTSLDSLNVVLVSLPDKFLDETTASLKANFPKQKFISVAAKFDHKTDYMPAIIEVRYLQKLLILSETTDLLPNCTLLWSDS